MDLSSTFITKMKSSLALASVAFSGASAASFEVRGADGNVQMHNTFLKVWSQADLTPSFSSLMDDRSMTHGLPLTHTMKLTNVPLTCASLYGEKPCVPYGEDLAYPKQFYCEWTDTSNSVLSMTAGPYSPTLRTIKHADGTVLAREARLQCTGPSGSDVRNAHHTQRLRVYFGAEGTDERVELAYVGRKNYDRIGVVATVAPTSAPTMAPTVAPTNAPTNAPTVAPTPAPTPECVKHHEDLSFGGWSAHTQGSIRKCRGDCDSDDHCAGGLKCAQRNAHESVPGCKGTSPEGGIDICYDPNFGTNSGCEKDEALRGGDWSRHQSATIQRCEGDCDEDSHCATGLVCHQRDSHEAVKGCTGSGISGMDYCARPN